MVGRVSPSIVKAWKSLSVKNITGASTASRYTSAFIKGSAEDGEIPVSKVGLVKSSYTAEQETFKTQIDSDLRTYYAADLITEDELNYYTGEISIEITDDTDTVIDALNRI